MRNIQAEYENLMALAGEATEALASLGSTNPDDDRLRVVAEFTAALATHIHNLRADNEELLGELAAICNRARVSR